MQPLIDLIGVIPGTVQWNVRFGEHVIGGLSSDSRYILPGALFFALPGVKQDGAMFVAAAAAAGAIGAVCGVEAKLPELPPEFCVIRVENPAVALALVAAKFYAPQPQCIVAVTGTDGKTSTVDFFRQLASMLGVPAASIGTLGAVYGNGQVIAEGTHTTLDSITLHQTLQKLAAQKITHVAMEASSHGLHQHRMDGVSLTAAAFTYLGRDHLDYHGTEEKYFRAKTRLFELLPIGKTAVLNVDDGHYVKLRQMCEARGCPVLTYGRGAADVHLVELKPVAEGQEVTLRAMGVEHRFTLPLVGDFQMMNILAATGLLASCGFVMNQVISRFGQLKGVRGRLEQAAPGIYVDYAHTPVALEKLLKTLRVHTKGRLHVVFGCGGDRDAGKRPEMGAIAAKLADVAMVTDDNPRSEDPAKIRAAILAACPGGKEIAGRKEAIYAAVQGLHPGDVLVIAGKGHETTQTIGAQIELFDDAAVVREAVGKL